jgi:hypothetical protein
MSPRRARPRLQVAWVCALYACSCADISDASDPEAARTAATLRNELISDPF